MLCTIVTEGGATTWRGVSPMSGGSSEALQDVGQFVAHQPHMTSCGQSVALIPHVFICGLGHVFLAWLSRVTLHDGIPSGLLHSGHISQCSRHVLVAPPGVTSLNVVWLLPDWVGGSVVGYVQGHVRGCLELDNGLEASAPHGSWWSHLCSVVATCAIVGAVCSFSWCPR